MNNIEKVSDIPMRWYTVSIRGGQKFEIDEATAEQFIKAEKIIVLRDDKNRILRYINKADVSDISWDKSLTREKFVKQYNIKSLSDLVPKSNENL